MGCADATTTHDSEIATPGAPAFYGTQIGPLGPVAKLSIGMTEADAKARAPELFDRDGNPALVDGNNKSEYWYGFSILDGRVDRFEVWFLSRQHEDLKSVINQAWGKGIDDGWTSTWFDPPRHWRAQLTGDRNLEITQYLPAAELLGSNPIGLAVFPKPILGAKIDDVIAAYPNHRSPTNYDGAAELDLPPLEWEWLQTSILLFFEEDRRVNGYSFDIPDYAGPKGTEEATLALFAKKWGEPFVKQQPPKLDRLIYQTSESTINVMRDGTNHSWQVDVMASAP